MKRRFAFGLMAAALLPAALIAQNPAPYASSGQRVLMEGAERVESPLPATPELSQPYQAPWLAKIDNDDALPASSRAEAALRSPIFRLSDDELPPTAAPAIGLPANGLSVANCNTCCDGYGGQRGGIRGLISSVRQWMRCFEPQVFHRGTMSAEFGSQYWRSPIWVSSANETRMVPLITRVGLMLNEPHPDRRLKGVFEAIAEADVIPIASGAGNIIVGGSGLLRYHRVRNHRMVPYVQAGFGGTWTDSAGLAGSPTTTNFNFITQLGMGSHIFLNQKWAIMNESSYVMIHNFGIGQGPGYHVLGGLVGITRFFGGGCDR